MRTWFISALVLALVGAGALAVRSTAFFPALARQRHAIEPGPAVAASGRRLGPVGAVLTAGRS